MADKKISQLPKINAISGSNGGEIIVPIVHDGTTQKMDVSSFGVYITQFNATTGSNTFIGNQTITGNTSIGGNLVVAGKLTAQELHTEITSASILFESGSSLFGNSVDDTHQFTGTLILNGLAVGTPELMAQTASQAAVNLRISSTTGSINTTTSSFDSVFQRISSTTGSINTTTSSFDSVFLGISSVTGAINTTTSSFDSVFQRISSTTGSINTTTSSFDSVFLGISSVTGAMNTQSSSQDLVNRQVSLVTGSIHFVTGAFNAFTGSVIGQTNTIATFTSSINFTTQSLNTQTGSQDLVNRGISSVTGSINTTTSSFDSVFLRISSTTGSINNTTSSFNSEFGKIGSTTASIHFTTQSLNTQTGSQESINTTISIVTGSMRAEIGGIEAYTASLKNAIIVNGTNVRIVGELTASRIYTEFITSSVLFVTGSNIIGDQSTDKHEFTGSVHINDTLFIKGIAQGNGELNAFTGSQIGKDFTLSVVTSSIDSHILKQATQTGSQDLVNRGISSVTGSINTTTSSFNSVFLGISSVTGAMNTQSSSQDLVNLGISSVTGSLIGIANGLMAFTAALDSTYATDAQLYQLYQATASIHFATQSLNTQTGSQDLVNLGISTFTGSLRSEVNLIEAYTASLKGAAIVSSSQQITNYYKFAETASANTFYGNQTFASSGGSGLRVYGAAGTHQWDVYLNGENLRISDNTVGDAALVVDTRASFGGHVTASGNFVVATAGNGIDFSATSNGSGTTTSELLNDYEEGTWTPVIRGDATAGTYELSSTNATYTKIGRQVTLAAQITLAGSITGGGSGYLQITGAPFTKGNNMAFVGATQLVGVDFTGQYVSVKFVSVSSTAILFFAETVDNGASVDLPISSIAASDSIAFTITYFV
jgi:hypothetical protein